MRAAMGFESSEEEARVRLSPEEMAALYKRHQDECEKAKFVAKVEYDRKLMEADKARRDFFVTFWEANKHRKTQ